MQRHAIRSGDEDDEKIGCQTHGGFRDVGMVEDGEDKLDRTQNAERMLEEVLKKVEKRYLMNIIRTRQKNWIGHILRGNLLQREIMEGRLEVKRGRGRPRQKLIDWIMED